MVCVPFWLSTTSANGVLPSLPSFTIVVEVTSLGSSLPSPFLSRPTLTVCVPSLLLTTSVNDDLPSSPLAPVAPVAPVAPSFTIVVEVTSLGSSLPSPFLSIPTLTVCVPSLLLTTSANGDFPSLPSLTMVDEVTSSESN